MSMNASAGKYTVVRFVSNNLVAIGTDSGLVDVWRVSDNEKIARFYAGTGSVTGIAANFAENSIYVSTSEGSLVGFDLPLQLTPLVPQRDLESRLPHDSLVWLIDANGIAYQRDGSHELVFVDPRTVQHPVEFKLGDHMEYPMTPIIFRTRKQPLVSRRLYRPTVRRSRFLLKLIYSRPGNHSGNGPNCHCKCPSMLRLPLSNGLGIMKPLRSDSAQEIYDFSISSKVERVYSRRGIKALFTTFFGYQIIEP